MTDLDITQKRLDTRHDTARAEYNKKQTQRAGEFHADREGRRKRGSLLDDTWQSGEDIGRRINGKPLSQEEMHEPMTVASSEDRQGSPPSRPKSSGTSRDQLPRVVLRPKRPSDDRDRPAADRSDRTVYTSDTPGRRLSEQRSSASSAAAASARTVTARDQPGSRPASATGQRDQGRRRAASYDLPSDRVKRPRDQSIPRTPDRQDRAQPRDRGRAQSAAARASRTPAE